MLKKVIVFFSFVVLFIDSFVCLYGQNEEKVLIQGKVIDEENHKPLSDAKLEFVMSQLMLPSVYSDSNGNFSIEVELSSRIRPLKLDYTVSKTCYKTRTETFSLVGDHYLDVRLQKEKSKQISEVLAYVYDSETLDIVSDAKIKFMINSIVRPATYIENGFHHLRITCDDVGKELTGVATCKHDTSTKRITISDKDNELVFPLPALTNGTIILTTLSLSMHEFQDRRPLMGRFSFAIEGQQRQSTKLSDEGLFDMKLPESSIGKYLDYKAMKKDYKSKSGSILIQQGFNKLSFGMEKDRTKAVIKYASLVIGVAATIYTAIIQKNINDKYDKYQNSAFSKNAQRYFQRANSYEKKRNIALPIASIGVGVSLYTFMF